MCGIAGVVALPGASVTRATLPVLLGGMPHRGPDGQDQFSRGNIALGMVRLAIIDVAGGQQPIWNEAGDVAIVCNGEIYNHLPLRRSLEARGHQFKTHSDVEAVLHLYEEVGEKCFEHLNGMFGCAIADFRGAAPEVILARDPFGQKPLYLWQTATHVHFASELKCLAGLDDFPRDLSPFALASFLQFRYVPWPHTIYQATRKLAPGSTCRITTDGKLAERRYFQINLGPGTETGPPDPDGSRTRKQFQDAVRRHLMSERPLGVFLSGGLDSSAVVACMHALGHQAIHTYTVGFEGFLDNEFATAHRVAEHFRTHHHEVTLGPERFWETLDQVVYSSDEPLADITTVPLYHLSEAASRELVVVLSGEGSDELLGGYGGAESLIGTFEDLDRLRFASPLARLGSRLPLPGQLRRKMEAVAGTAADYLSERRYNMTQVFSTEALQTHGAPSIRGLDPGQMLVDYYQARRHWDGGPLSFGGGLIEWWLPDDLLHKADRMTMAHSLELRCPFLDTEFARHCASLPMSDKVRSSPEEPNRKIALKRAFAGQLPPGIAMQPKKGFVIPAYRWLERQYAERARAELQRESALGCSLVARPERLRLLDAAIAGDTKAQHSVWVLLILNKWGSRWA